jgi:hypothetical protein
MTRPYHASPEYDRAMDLRHLEKRMELNMQRLHIAALSKLLLIAVTSTAGAEGSSLPYGGGGVINAPAIVARYNASGEPFRIEGSCRSSCTMLLAIKNVCVEPNATLMFHAALLPNQKGQQPNPQKQASMLNS